MSDKKQDNMSPSASDAFRKKEDRGINDATKEKKYKVEPPKLMKIPDFLSDFPWGGGV